MVAIWPIDNFSHTPILLLLEEIAILRNVKAFKI